MTTVTTDHPYREPFAPVHSDDFDTAQTKHGDASRAQIFNAVCLQHIDSVCSQVFVVGFAAPGGLAVFDGVVPNVQES